MAQLYLFLTKSLYKNRQFQKGQIEGLKAIDFIKSEESKALAGDIYLTLARNSRYLNQYDSAIHFYQKAVEFLALDDDYVGMSIAYNNIGAAHKIKGDYTEALEYYFKDLELNKLHDLPKDQAIACNNIGQVMLITRDYETAIDYFNKAEVLCREINDQKGIALANSNKGSVYHLMQKKDEALQFFFTALNIFDELGNQQFRVAETLTNIGNTYIEKEDLVHAESYINRALKVFKQIDNLNGIMKASYLKGEILYNQKKYKQAITYLFKAEKYYQQSTHYRVEYRNTLLLIHKCLSASGDYKKAYNYQLLYAEVNTKVNNSKEKEVMAKLNKQFESKEQKLLIDQLHKDTLLKNQQISFQHRISIFLLVLCLFLFTFMVFIFFIHQRGKKTHQLIKEQNREITSIHSELIESLRFARKIQYSLIALSDRVKEVIPDHFIFWQPIQEVSGDVYHMEYKHGRLFITLMDCTGHGAPASLMATLCIKTLNDIINDEIIHPDEILEELDDRIKDENNIEQSLTGVDASIITYNFETETIEFSGARRPVYIIDEEGEYYIKGTKKSICDTLIGKESTFVRHSKKLTSDTKVYMYSDGFSDQFGGLNNKKFKEPNLRKLLSKIHHQNMADQKKQLKNTYWNWRSPSKDLEYNATDDTLVLGFNFKIKK
ncbi:tetratricopeptide repeat protein [Flammeovirga sp. MY04]|uniref:tetratricopeptide repeat protein n=1 Tax=Flammeovirga sp. MY04 TaxID=1191459 RepID=UPI0013050D19|nr:tetratricopeptide repeat protein [Flammeovirga sp. MY04]ANQ50015.2 tetratricopeptide repeat protein [Flammeovirga sp. MY04]